jgi:hypothetical protein
VSAAKLFLVNLSTRKYLLWFYGVLRVTYNFVKYIKERPRYNLYS